MWRNLLVFLVLLSQAFGQPMANNDRLKSNPGSSSQVRMGVGWPNIELYKTPGSNVVPIPVITSIKLTSRPVSRN
jgi:hypothetical protein